MTDMKKTEKGTSGAKGKKLRLNKETLRDLKARDEDRVKGGAAMTGNRPSCAGVPNC